MTSTEGGSCSWAAYFLRPFPKGGGFSAYRFPGLLVHIPVILLSLGVAVLLCREHASPAILGIYFLLGLYAGRDLAIRAHYNPLVTLAVWGALALCLFGPPHMVSGWTRSLNHAVPLAPWGVTALLIIAFATNVWLTCRKQ